MERELKAALQAKGPRNHTLIIRREVKSGQASLRRNANKIRKTAARLSSLQNRGLTARPK